MLNRLRIHNYSKLLSDSIWSVLGNLAAVLGGLATVKIVTQMVTTEAFGQASLALGLVMFLSGFVAGPVLAAHNRTYFDYRQTDKKDWFIGTFKWILGAATVVMFLVYLVISLIYFLFDNTIYLDLVIPALLLIVAQTYLSMRTNYIEAGREQRKLAILSALQRAFGPILLFLLLTIAVPQIHAIILAQGIAALILLLIFRRSDEHTLSVVELLKNKSDLVALKNSLFGFGGSLAFSFVTIWIITTSDRYLIGHFGTLQEVGIYSVNYSFWSLPYLMVNAWLEVLTRPIIYDKAANGEWSRVKVTIYSRVALGLSLSIVGTVLILALLEPISTLLLGETYRVGWEFVMAIAISHCFYVLGNSVLPIFLATKTAHVILVANTIAAIVNVATNLVVIPRYGVLGAAMATLISYVAWTIILLIRTRFVFQQLAVSKSLLPLG